MFDKRVLRKSYRLLGKTIGVRSEVLSGAIKSKNDSSEYI